MGEQSGELTAMKSSILESFFGVPEGDIVHQTCPKCGLNSTVVLPPGAFPPDPECNRCAIDINFDSLPWGVADREGLS